MISKGDRIISASRRTDIPAFYMEWFMDRVHKGYFEVTNPYNKVSKKIDASPSRVHTIVFWSKNYEPFLESGAMNELKQMGYNLFFHFSINSETPLLEPEIPSLAKRLAQLEKLCENNDPGAISWRFDPVCYFKTSSGGIVNNNLSDFSIIAKKASEFGIKRCITSFADNYRKIKRRIQRLNNNGVDAPQLIDISHAKKRKIIIRMADLLNKNNIELFLCSEKELFYEICAEDRDLYNIKESACISGPLFEELFGGRPLSKRDYGQRTKQGCRCTQSVDIGSYEAHPCYHNCLFCYANPAIDKEI